MFLGVCARVARWCREHCDLHPDRTRLDVNDPDHQSGVIWPWNLLHWMYENNKFLSWVHDDPNLAHQSVGEFWNHVSHLPFYGELQLEHPEWTVPIAWHCDGVKVFKTHKVWVYSMSACTRKGPSIDTKLLFLILRDTLIVKDKTHDSVGRLIAYCMDVLMSGNYPQKRPDGTDFPPNSLEAQRANTPFCNGWKFAFAAWKGDLEARVICHKLVRNWAADSICEHCLASKINNGFGYTDFTDNAAYFECMLSHDDFVLLNPPNKQSAWLAVRGWQKDRNLDEPWTDPIYIYILFILFGHRTGFFLFRICYWMFLVQCWASSFRICCIWFTRESVLLP